MEQKSDLKDLEQAPSLTVTMANTTTTHDAVFGEITEDGPNYRNVGWIGIIGLMMKTQIGLGVLSIPAVFDALGLIPGLICLLVIAGMITWTTYMVGVFKLKHPEVYAMNDVGYLLFGRIGRELFGWAYALYYTFFAGSAFLSLSIGLNAVSDHGACTAVFVVVSALVGFIFGSIRTLGRLTWLTWAGLVSIMVALITVTIAVSVQDRPASAPQEGSWKSDYKLFNSPTFASAISGVSSLVFSFGGTPAFFALVAEMREPRMYTRSLLICQTGVTVVYATIGIVIYYYCGSYVSSPALGSAGPLMKRIGYGLALPGLTITTILLTHLPSKYIFVRILRGSRHLTSNSLIHWVSWLGCTFAVSLVAYIIASAVPNFSALVSLVGSLLGAFLCLACVGCMWFYDNWRPEGAGRGLKRKLTVAWSSFIILSGCFLMVGGTYGAVISIIDIYSQPGGSGSWSCADNSGST